MTSQQKHRAAAMRAVATVTLVYFVFGFIAFNVLFVDEKRWLDPTNVAICEIGLDRRTFLADRRTKNRENDDAFLHIRRRDCEEDFNHGCYAHRRSALMQ